MFNRGPLYCTYPSCDRYSLRKYGWFKTYRFWIRAKDLLKDYDIDVCSYRWSGRFKAGNCHHHE